MAGRADPEEAQGRESDRLQHAAWAAAFCSIRWSSRQADKLLKEAIGLTAIHWGTGAEQASRRGLASTPWAAGSTPTCSPAIWSGQPGSSRSSRNIPFASAGRTTNCARSTTSSSSSCPTPGQSSKCAIDKEEYPVAWVYERPDGGRSFGFVGGHFHENFGIKDFRKAIVNGILWTAHVNVPPEGASGRNRRQGHATAAGHAEEMSACGLHTMARLSRRPDDFLQIEVVLQVEVFLRVPVERTVELGQGAGDRPANQEARVGHETFEDKVEMAANVLLLKKVVAVAPVLGIVIDDEVEAPEQRANCAGARPET